MYTLITAANSSEAHALRNKLGDDHILLGDYEELPAFLLNSGKMISLPDPAESSYVHRMLTLCLDKNIDNLYPLRQNEAGLLLNSSQLFAEYGISIFTDDKIQ
jgi:hypothetical protein